LYEKGQQQMIDLSKLARATQVVGVAGVPAVAGRVLEGRVRGRSVVDVNA
jgi:acrylyl-CoA reductase (NADPH)